MSSRSLSGLPGVALVGAIALAGVAGRDCLLLATSMVLAYRLFRLRMDRGAC